VPVFAPPNELGFQASIEAFNGRWQQKLWARFWDPDLTALQERSAGYVGASRRRAVARIEPAPPRSSFPIDRVIDLAAPPSAPTADPGDAESSAKRNARRMAFAPPVRRPIS